MIGSSGDTIFALSSGNPPAAIAIVRVSGPQAGAVLAALAGAVSEPRRATLASLRDQQGDLLDRALVLLFPGPGSVTGEDLAEFHIHGGRSVVSALLAALGSFPGLRAAEPGEFTRRAFENGRMDLTEVEGLSDLLQAETEGQRRAALGMVGGLLRRRVEAWQTALLGLAARLEAVLDLADEAEVGETLARDWHEDLAALKGQFEAALAGPPAERLRDGIRVVIAGPPNAGKSSLLNALCGREAAITSPEAGTTRDVVEAPIALAGIPFLLADTAGLRDSANRIEAIGIERAGARLADADIILWLGDPDQCPDRDRALILQSRSDLLAEAERDARACLHLSPVSGEGMGELVNLLVERSKALLPREGEAALNARHRAILQQVISWLDEAQGQADLVIAAEAFRQARVLLDRITGRAGVEDMLDALFGTFCVGK